MSREQAVDLATRFARDQGLPVDRYAASAEQDAGAWVVHFSPGPAQPKPAPGDFFTVVIDAHGAPRLVPGK